MSDPIDQDAKWWNADLLETIFLPHKVEEIKLILGTFGVSTNGDLKLVTFACHCVQKYSQLILGTDLELYFTTTW